MAIIVCNQGETKSRMHKLNEIKMQRVFVFLSTLVC